VFSETTTWFPVSVKRKTLHPLFLPAEGEVRRHIGVHGDGGGGGGRRRGRGGGAAGPLHLPRGEADVPHRRDAEVRVAEAGGEDRRGVPRHGAGQALAQYRRLGPRRHHAGGRLHQGCLLIQESTCGVRA